MELVRVESKWSAPGQGENEQVVVTVWVGDVQADRTARVTRHREEIIKEYVRERAELELVRRVYERFEFYLEYSSIHVPGEWADHVATWIRTKNIDCKVGDETLGIIDFYDSTDFVSAVRLLMIDLGVRVSD